MSHYTKTSWSTITLWIAQVCYSKSSLLVLSLRAQIGNKPSCTVAQLIQPTVLAFQRLLISACVWTQSPKTIYYRSNSTDRDGRSRTLMYSSFVYSGILSPSVRAKRLISAAYSSKIFTTLKMVTTISTALYPCSQSWFTFSTAPSMSPFKQARIVACMMMGCGWSHTLNTLSPETKPKPEYVDCRLLMACRISPSDVNMSAVRPSSLYSTCHRMRWGNKRKNMTNLFHFADFKKSFQNFLVPEFGVSENSASTLNGFDNLVAHIAG